MMESSEGKRLDDLGTSLLKERLSNERTSISERLSELPVDSTTPHNKSNDCLLPDPSERSRLLHVPVLLCAPAPAVPKVVR
jgi:hypothetical protein